MWELEAHKEDHFDFCIHDTLGAAVRPRKQREAISPRLAEPGRHKYCMLNVIETFQLDMPSVTFTREDESGKTKEVHMGDESIVDVCA